MVSYLKTQWFSALIGLVFFIIACCLCFVSTPDPDTIEELAQNLRIMKTTYICVLASMSWLSGSLISYNRDCIAKLDERVKVLEASKEDEDGKRSNL
jgi:hypothetical protein